MNIQSNILKFETELMKIKRDGIDRLLNYCRSSDFYTAPSSTQYHLSVKGGLLQHSLNVLDALRNILTKNSDGSYSYTVAGKPLVQVNDETVIIISLLHDLCKTKFYSSELRNKKINGIWKEVEAFSILDEIPYGHGEKSVMMADSFIKLSLEEKMTIRWHMGFPDDYQGKTTFGAAIDKYPLIWALHTADLMASHFMEDKEDNRPLFY